MKTKILKIIVPILLIVSCKPKNSTEMEDKYADRPQLLEILHWTHADGVDPKLSLHSMQGFAVEMNKYGTLPRKDFANNHNNWFSVNYWKDGASKTVINKEAVDWESNKVFFPAIAPGTFTLLEYEFDYSDAEDALPGGNATCIEAVYMKQKDGADPAAISELFHSLTPKMGGDGTLFERVVGKNAEGHWILLNYWKDNNSRIAMNAKAQSFPEGEKFGELIDLSSMKLETFFLRSKEDNPKEVIEIAVRSVKEGMMETFVANREKFIKVWMDNEGAASDREYESIFGMPNTENPKFIGMTSWSSQENFGAAGQNPEVQKVAPNFMGTFDMLAFVTAKPIEGDFNLASIIQNDGEILELAIRRIKNLDEAEEFHKRRKAYVAKLDEVEGVLASYEFEPVFSGVGDGITIGMTEYANQEAVDRAGQSVNQGPEAKAFQEMMEVVTFNYLKRVK